MLLVLCLRHYRLRTLFEIGRVCLAYNSTQKSSL